MVINSKSTDSLQVLRGRAFKEHQIQLIGYLIVFSIFLLTHLINLVEYPKFSTDEMFYVQKAICWKKYEIPCVYSWYGGPYPEFTNPSTFPWLLMVLFAIFGTDPLILRLFMLAISILNLQIVFLIGREIDETPENWRGFFVGIIGGLVLALDQDLIYFSRIGYPDNPMNLCLTVFLYLYLKYMRTGNQKYAWLAGLAAGIGLWFKLSSLFLIIGLAIFVVPTRDVDGPLRVQAMMSFFIGLYVLWGLSIDPTEFVEQTTYHITREHEANPFQFWLNLIFYDNISKGYFIEPIRTLILFSLFIPIFYYRNRRDRFYQSSVLILCLFLGVMIFYTFFSKTLYSYYLAGFASFYAILFAISVVLIYELAQIFQQNYLLSSNIPKNLQKWLTSGARAVFLIIFLVFFIQKFYYGQAIISSENQEYLEIISFIEQNISKEESLVAPIEIGTWLNASGYQVFIIWLNVSPPDHFVRRYIERNVPSYLVLHKDYLYIPEGLNYSSVHTFPNFEVLKQNNLNSEGRSFDIPYYSRRSMNQTIIAKASETSS